MKKKRALFCQCDMNGTTLLDNMCSSSGQCVRVHERMTTTTTTAHFLYVIGVYVPPLIFPSLTIWKFERVRASSYYARVCLLRLPSNNWLIRWTKRKKKTPSDLVSAATKFREWKKWLQYVALAGNQRKNELFTTKYKVNFDNIHKVAAYFVPVHVHGTPVTCHFIPMHECCRLAFCSCARLT